MIYTVTFNPSLDYIVRVDEFKIGEVNRTIGEEIYPGGKGINVSIVLNNLGVKSVALGFVSGFTGKEIEKRVKEYGVKSNFIKLKNGNSRINVKLKSSVESEINAQGAKIEKEDLNEFFYKLQGVQEDDFLVLSGSIPNTVPENIYEDIMKKLKDKHIKVVVDATSNLLLNVLKYKPFLIKPNHHELGELFNTTIKTDEDIIYFGKKLQSMGAENVVISMAEKGAIFISSSGEVIKSKAPKGVLKNSVGAGDSMVAGFIFGYLKNKDLMEAFKFGVATGSATAFSKGLATKSQVETLLKQKIIAKRIE
ncbi:1-phosphofructokinase [Clostridium novyi]|uniref:Tagatose-6-phosphate kinase n=1 Tax=Clostridium novyi (strain NT) TaxID=386415 RepID=A0PZK2_CLONN|nr:1-phosphofructokinase [Clostridium novyi]ABK61680.1 1-phosphofructokinase [Clostridium novyi NT]KEH85342.1 1-phosphofructokinase [Clostridium novyi A str. NCTC 538]